MPIKTPFSRVAIDLIGPLPASDRGNRWVLTLVDCAMRYPEGIPMKRIETTDVAEELVSISSQVGVPEMLSDQGAQFTSELIQKISRLLSLKQLFTAPYHAMCNGQVERLNGTLKSMDHRETSRLVSLYSICTVCLQGSATGEPWVLTFRAALWANTSRPNVNTGLQKNNIKRTRQPTSMTWSCERDSRRPVN